MRELTDGCAVVTGGGGLLGRGLASAFGAAGMRVVVADVDLDSARRCASAVQAQGGRARAARVDVTDLDDVRRFADSVREEFGRVDLLCNNAGTGVVKSFVELTASDWAQVTAVQWGGVLNGVLAFLPGLLAQREPSHIVNTASMSGVGRADLRTRNAPYVAAKFAVVGLSEVMAPALAPHGIGVSVVCPGKVVADPTRVPPARTPSGQWYVDNDNCLTPADVAAEVVRGVRENRLHIFTHHAGRREVEDRHARLLSGFDDLLDQAGARNG